MYQDYFGFEEMPFNITPDPKFLYMSSKHEEALEHLRYGVFQKKGFIVITGEVGCGKTTLCRRLVQELEAKQFDFVLLLNPCMDAQVLMQNILKDLGVRVAHNSKADLMDKLYRVLIEKIEAGREIVIIIDEAQNLSYEVLEHVRLLSNLETDNQKLLQIVLMGQPELKDKLKQKRLRQLRQRVLVHYDLKSLNFRETAHYIHHRLSTAKGGKHLQFTFLAIRYIYKKSAGIPRIINNLCDKSLLSAYIKSRNTVGLSDARKASKEIKQLA